MAEDDTCGKSKGPAVSLRSKALRHLSQREHSQAELKRKLQRALARADAASHVEGAARADDSGAAVQAVLDELAARGLQSDERTAEALVSAKAARWGERRLQAELHRRGIAPDLAAQALQGRPGSELERARALWSRRFGNAAPATTPAERARQARYLAGRGFAADIIRRVVQGLHDDE